MLKLKQTLRSGQVIDAEWWAATKVFAMILASVAVGIAIVYAFT